MVENLEEGGKGTRAVCGKRAEVVKGIHCGAPRIISCNITLRCPLKCSHGYVDAGKDEAAGALSTAEALAVIDQIRAIGTPVVVLSGGEPLKIPSVLSKKMTDLFQNRQTRASVTRLNNTFPRLGVVERGTVGSFRKIEKTAQRSRIVIRFQLLVRNLAGGIVLFLSYPFYIIRQKNSQ